MKGYTTVEIQPKDRTKISLFYQAIDEFEDSWHWNTETSWWGLVKKKTKVYSQDVPEGVFMFDWDRDGIYEPREEDWAEEFRPIWMQIKNNDTVLMDSEAYQVFVKLTQGWEV